MKKLYKLIMKDKTMQNVNIEESKRSKEEEVNENTFWKRFTCVKILKILYLLLAVSFGHGIFSLIIYFMANKKYGLYLTIGAVISGVLHFLYECYKILYNEEILMEKIILKNNLKIRLINEKRYRARVREFENK